MFDDSIADEANFEADFGANFEANFSGRPGCPKLAPKLAPKFAPKLAPTLGLPFRTKGTDTTQTLQTVNGRRASDQVHHTPRSKKARLPTTTKDQAIASKMHPNKATFTHRG